MNVIFEVNGADVDTIDYFEVTLPQLVATAQHHAKVMKCPINDVAIRFEEAAPTEAGIKLVFEVEGAQANWMDYQTVTLYRVRHKANCLNGEQKIWLNAVTLHFIPEDGMEVTLEGELP